MPWFYVDDGFSDSKPVLNMPDRYRLGACGLWVLAGSWSAKEETDGFVPETKLRALGARDPVIAALTDPGSLSSPLCTRVSDGLQFNSWSKWQPTKSELAAERAENERKREAEAERKRRERAEKNGEESIYIPRRRKGRNTVASANPPINDVTSEKRPDGHPEGHPQDESCDSRAHAGARLDPTRPDPTRSTSSGHLEGGTHVNNGRAKTEPPPPCPDHPHGWNHEDRCRLCGALREWDQAAPQRQRRAEVEQLLERRRLRQDTIAACPHCDDKGQMPHPDLPDCSTPCTHHERIPIS